MAEVGSEETAADLVKHENIGKLSVCAVTLLGETVLPQPRVSREVMTDSFFFQTPASILTRHAETPNSFP